MKGEREPLVTCKHIFAESIVCCCEVSVTPAHITDGCVVGLLHVDSIHWWDRHACTVMFVSLIHCSFIARTVTLQIELPTLIHLGRVVNNDVGLYMYHETLLKEWFPLNYEADQYMHWMYRPPYTMLIPDRFNEINESMMKHNLLDILRQNKCV